VQICHLHPSDNIIIYLKFGVPELRSKTFYPIMSAKNEYVANGDKRLKLTDIDEETLNSGAEG
jgi:hypothetical protein